MLKPYEAIEDRNKARFFDDFIGTSYDNRVWGAVGGVGCTATYVAPCIGGQLRFRCGANVTYELNQLDVTNYSAAKNAEVVWRMKVPSRANLDEVRCGLEGNATYRPNTFIEFYLAATGNWKCYSQDQGSYAVVDTGVAYDANWHTFRIRVATGLCLFYIDEVLVATTLSYITAVNLQPFVYMDAGVSGTLDCLIDYCIVTGDRA
jgi:hypothetical protein